MLWIDEQLTHAKAKEATHILIFQHIPFFLETPDEAKQYFNLDNVFRMKMLEKFSSAGNFRHIRFLLAMFRFGIGRMAKELAQPIH